MSHAFVDPPDQLGCVVPDLQAAIEEWAAKGVGPFLVMRNVTLGGYVYEGRPSKPKIDVAFSQQGDLQIELIQPINDEPSAYRDFLAAGGSGAHHDGWFCVDYTGETDAAARAGHTELQSGAWGGLHFVYYHPLSDERRITELIEMNDLSRDLFGLIRREAGGWDGTKPSRSLLAAADWGLRWTALKVQVATLLGRT